MEILILFLVVIIGFAAGWYAREQVAMAIVKQFLSQVEEKEHIEEDTRTKMVLEKHDDIIFAYTAEGHEFMAQGKDLFELDSAIQARYPGKKFAVQEDNLKEIAVEYHESV